ncbi:MAG: FUSC family protein [Alsobacter sp.]
MSGLDRLKEDHLLGVHFALNVFIASILAWASISLVSNANPVWAMASLVAASEPVPSKGYANFVSRLTNTAVGCAVGLGFLLVGDPHPWKLPFALAIAVLLSVYVVRVPVMWRQAPITAAIVVAGSVTEHSKLGGIDLGLRRVAEVLFGCVVALLVSWAMSRIWPIQAAAKPSASPPSEPSRPA